ncbi:TRAP transporter small permease subunit [Chloroflexota bacterium]
MDQGGLGEAARKTMISHLKFSNVIQFLSFTAGLFLFGIMALVVVDVTLRALLNRPIQASLESVEFLMVGVVFLGLAYTQRKRGFVRMELIVSRLSSSARWYVDYVGFILMISFFAIFTWQAAIVAWRSIQIREYTWGLVPLPIYPAKIAITIGCGVILIELILEIVQHHREKRLWSK